MSNIEHRDIVMFRKGMIDRFVSPGFKEYIMGNVVGKQYRAILMSGFRNTDGETWGEYRMQDIKTGEYIIRESTGNILTLTGNFLIKVDPSGKGVDLYG